MHGPCLILALALAPVGMAQDDAGELVHTEESTFLGGAGPWLGGAVADGVLSLSGDAATVELAGATRLAARLLLRQRDAAALRIEAEAADGARATWTADYTDGGALTLEGPEGPGSVLHFPREHRTWRTEREPALRPDPGVAWEAGSLLHAAVHRDAASGLWYLYYTGVMHPGYGYRQIGLATSPDARTWTKHADNPLITIDYSRDTVDGVHAHMPSVVVDGDGLWHMFHSCYQDGVGNRICHATSSDGEAWTRAEPRSDRVALDLGDPGAFDDASVREPAVSIDADGTFRMFYVGTRAGEHYGPAGLAASTDGGWTWTRVGQVSDGESELQGGSVVASAHGLEQWYQCGSSICFAASPAGADGTVDWTAWTLDGEHPVLEPGWAEWNQSYIQAPTVWLADGRTLHMWFNGNTYGVDVEVLGHARTTPRPDRWVEVDLRWDGATVGVRFGDGPVLETTLGSVARLHLGTDGQAELDESWLEWSVPAGDDDTGAGDAGPADSGGAAGGEDSGGPAPAAGSGGEAESPRGSGCGECSSRGTSRAWALWLVAGISIIVRRRRSSHSRARALSSPWRSHAPPLDAASRPRPHRLPRDQGRRRRG